MSRSSSEVGKVGQRLGTLQAPPLLGVPNLPNLPNLLTRERAGAHPRIYARVGDSFYVGKVRKVGNSLCLRGLQPSQPLPYLMEVRQLNQEMKCLRSRLTA